MLPNQATVLSLSTAAENKAYTGGERERRLAPAAGMILVLSFAVIIGTVPFSVLAEETENTQTFTENTDKENENYGKEIEIGNDLYSIQEDGLYESINFGKNTKIDDGVITWLIEHNGALYWSKIEENNTYVYRKIYQPVK